MIGIITFGQLDVWQAGKRVALPSSRKTRALLAYLVLLGRPASRQELCSLLWELPDDPRGALRWSLSKLRNVLNADGVERLTTDGEMISIDRSRVIVDVDSLALLGEDPNADPHAMGYAWKLSGLTCLEDCELPNLPEYSAWLESYRHEVEGWRAALARRLARGTDLEPAEREKWADRWLGVAPFDPDAAGEVVHARRRSGREGEAQELAGKLRGEFAGAGIGSPDFSHAAGSEQSHAPATAPIPEQRVQFLSMPDDATIAWAATGDPAKPPLVKAANWLSHLERDWEAPIWSPLFRRLSSSYHFVRYDERGCGLSDWDVADISQASFVDDLAAVVDAAELDRFPLLGISQGAAVSIEYAAKHPERVSHLILFGGYDQGWRLTDTEEQMRVREAVMTLTEAGWGIDSPVYRQLYSGTMIPSANSAEVAWFNEFLPLTTSPRNAVRFLEAFSWIDVADKLASVQCPTLVIHSRGDMRIPLDTGRRLAAKIPGARFATLDTNNHLLLGREPASAEFVQLVTEFIGRTSA